MLDKLNSADFSPYLNRKFRIHHESMDPIEVELVEVTDLGSNPDEEDEGSKKRPFSIVFRGAMEPNLPQGIYDLEHEEVGTLSLFMVPIGPDKEGMRYEAVFN